MDFDAEEVLLIVSKPPYRQQYRPEWERNPLFSAWLCRSEDGYGGYCKACNSTVLSRMASLKEHRASRKHKKNMARFSGIGYPTYTQKAVIETTTHNQEAVSCAETLKSGALKRLVPLFDRVLIKKAEAVTKTKGGIVIPEKAAGKVLQGTVVAVGPGQRKDDGSHIPIAVKVGEQVLLPEYGGTKVEIAENEEYHLYRETDILAKVGA